LIDLLDPQHNERILDLGCGTGELAQAITEKGATVIGLDADPQMIAKAKHQFPAVTFQVADARSFHLPEPLDAVFSNAALHWVPESERVVASIAKSLKPGGRFVAEFGGKGNVGAIAKYLDEATNPELNPWYFPSIADYSSLLEKYDLEVIFAQLYDRPTPLNEGKDGLRNWILMFGESFLEDLSSDEKEQVLRGAEESLRPILYNGTQWVADYRRIRVVAKRVVNGIGHVCN
jgi:trans-aconitate methyltransferase